MPPFNPVICDLDGTVLDSQPAIVASLRAACAEHSSHIPTDDELARCVGPPLKVGLASILGPEAPFDDLISAYRRHYFATAEANTSAMPEVEQVLEELTDLGIQLGIASYKPREIVEPLLRAARLRRFFKTVKATSLDDHGPTKTELLRSAIEELRMPNARPLFVGDHDEDESAAQQLSVAFVRYPQVSWRQVKELITASMSSA